MFSHLRRVFIFSVLLALLLAGIWPLLMLVFFRPSFPDLRHLPADQIDRLEVRCSGPGKQNESHVVRITDSEQI